MILIRLFSVFDPISFAGVSVNWGILLIIVFLIPTKLFLIERNYSKFWKSFQNLIQGIFNEIAGIKSLGLVWVRVGIFIYLILRNLYRLIPYIFTGSAHPLVTIGLGCVLWFSFIFVSLIKNFTSLAAHLVPEGRPLLLSPILVIIEVISHLIRPFTLAVRLAANIIAGHLIIGLLARIRLVNYLGFFRSLFLQGFLLILEVGVAVIQGFVFSILLLLYALEYC